MDQKKKSEEYFSELASRFIDKMKVKYHKNVFAVFSATVKTK